MIYLFENGRIIYDESLLIPEDEGKFLEFETLPEVPFVENKIGYISGCNLETKEVYFSYYDKEPKSIQEPTEQDKINAFVISVLQDIQMSIKGDDSTNA